MPVLLVATYHEDAPKDHPILVQRNRAKYWE